MHEVSIVCIGSTVTVLTLLGAEELSVQVSETPSVDVIVSVGVYGVVGTDDGQIVQDV